MWRGFFALLCRQSCPALAQIRYKNLARAIFSSLWNGVPGVRNPNRCCVFVYQTRRLLESCYRNIAATVSVNVFIQGQRDRTHAAYSTVYVTVFILTCQYTCVYRAELRSPRKPDYLVYYNLEAG